MDLYEQKYKKALDWMRDVYPTLRGADKEDAEYFFPELAESEDEKIRKALKEYFINSFQNNGVAAICGVHIKDILAWLEKQGEQKSTLPKWKYKKDNTPLLRDSLILNKYGCVAKSPSGAIVSDVWIIDYDELAKLPKEESEKQGKQILANSVKTCKDEQKPNPCDGCINRKGCINCENGELRETVQEEPKQKMSVEEAMTYIDDKSKAFTEAHKGESADEILSEMRGEEPVSEDLDEEVKRLWQEINTGHQYSILDSYNQFYGMCLDICEWQKEQMEAYRIKHCNSITNEQAELEDKFVSSHIEKNNRMPTYLDAIEYGIEYGKQQMMKDTVEEIVDVDSNGLACINVDGYLPGDKIKVYIFKEE